MTKLAEATEVCDQIREDLRRTVADAEEGAKAVQKAVDNIADVEAKVDRHIFRLELGDDEATPIDPFPVQHPRSRK